MTEPPTTRDADPVPHEDRLDYTPSPAASPSPDAAPHASSPSGGTPPSRVMSPSSYPS